MKNTRRILGTLSVLSFLCVVCIFFAAPDLQKILQRFLGSGGVFADHRLVNFEQTPSQLDQPFDELDIAFELELELELIKSFVTHLHTSYPFLLQSNGHSIYPELKHYLSHKAANVKTLLQMKTRLYETLESQEKSHPDWYSIYHALHMYSVRHSRLAKRIFSLAIDQLKAAAKEDTYDKVLVPGSGKFFEFPEVVNKFNASFVVAEDIDHSSIEFTRAMFSDNAKLVLRHADLSQIQPDKTSYDALLFIHPHVTDYEDLSESDLYQQYDDEFKIPYEKIKKQKKEKYLSSLWRKIITNCFSRLKPGGHGFFVFYEHRELDIVIEWLKNFPALKVVHTQRNSAVIDFAFAKDYLESLGTQQEDTAKYVVMGAYRAGLLVQKME